MKKKVIAYVHSHWDREWYREYEIFRMRLVRVFDNVLDMLERNKLPSFYFDGQTAALLDYLEIRPEKEELIRCLIKDKRLFIGPFYCLVDEFLTDENCFRKNLELGLKTAKDFGCEDFVGYFADTFGHSASTISILKDFGIQTAIVWRGVGDASSEFLWCDTKDNKINAINLVRGYFNDVFSAPWSIDKKSEFIKTNLDKIAEKSGDILLMPIGADHLGIETDLLEQIALVNEKLDDYHIEIGTIFEYIDAVKDRFNQCEVTGELLDNSKTFILEGCYSSRLDIKKYNTVASYKLDVADKLIKHTKNITYKPFIEYAYKLLLQNQAHDSICGCSTDDVHFENIIRYKKIIQIADNIINEISFTKKSENIKILNLSDKKYKGTVEFKSVKDYPYQIVNIEKGFDKNILADTQKIPITEDYTDIKTYCAFVNAEIGLNELSNNTGETDVFVTDTSIGNSKIFLIVENNEIRLGNKKIRILDFEDKGDTYNRGYSKNNEPQEAEIIFSKKYMEGDIRSTLRIDVRSGEDIMHINTSLDKESPLIHFHIEWENTRKNHLLQLSVETGNDITVTKSEDFDNIIERNFNPQYNVLLNLPEEKGIEVKTNSRPMHRGVIANEIGIVTEGITQYEICGSELRIPLLRAVGVISNPKNPARTTPAGPPLEVLQAQKLGKNISDFWIFQGNNLEEMINQVYNKCVIICE